MKKCFPVLMIISMTFFVMIFVSISGCSSTPSSASPITPSVSLRTQSCIGNCIVGQSATDGYYNHQKITVNKVSYLTHPYNDPDPDVGYEWHNWDWIILNISIENLRSEKTTDYGIWEMKGANKVDLQCWHKENVELSDYNFMNIPPKEVRTGKIGCLIDPKATMPFTFYYYFDNWYGIKSGDGGSAAKFSIDKFTPLYYNSIKSSLHGPKPF
jgi:hypothetical protein